MCFGKFHVGHPRVGHDGGRITGPVRRTAYGVGRRPVDADAHQFPLHPHHLIGIGAEQRDGRAPLDHPAEVGDGVAVHLEGQGTLDVFGGEDASFAQVDHPLAGLNSAGDLRGRGQLRQREVDRAGSALVGRTHVGVVGGVGVQSGDEVGNERLLVHVEGRVAQQLLGQRGLVAHGGGGAAERTKSVGGVDPCRVAYLAGDSPHGVPLRPGKWLGQLRPEKVGATDTAEEHGAAGEQGEVDAAVVHRERHVVGRVPRRVQNPHETHSGVQLRLVADLVGRE